MLLVNNNKHYLLKTELMKNWTLVLVTFFCVLMLDAQNSIIAINSTTDAQSGFGPERLIEEVLVSGGCSGVSDFSYQVYGQPGDTNTKSYGYFNKRNANFPFGEGVILSTGQAYGGGNTSGPGGVYPDFNNGLSGDADLALAINKGRLQDATFIKFNFVPLANAISFRFIMASEEYDGSTECSFADGFAFLLREVGTTAYTNLAVLPDGTPVSVKNINDAGNCKKNPAYFEGYNLPDTNYGGRTKVLIAKSEVIPGRSYEIKLVVADQGDSSWDSAIFLEAGSFNLGVDLGEDRTISGGNAVCPPETVTLDTKSPTATHTWFFNGTEIPGAGTGSVLTVTRAGTYSVDVDFGITCFTNDEIVIEFSDPVNIVNTQDLRTCSAGSNSGLFNLTDNDSNVLGTEDPTLYNITYHNSQVDATNDDNPIDTAIEYTGQNGEIVYVRLENALTGCNDTAMFTLFVNNINFALDNSYTLCVDTDGTEVISLPVLNIGLNTTDYTFEWYLNDVLLDGEVNNSYTPIQGGNYSVVVTDIATNCKTNVNDPNANTIVYESSRPILTVEQVSLVFVEKNTILATAISASALTNGNAQYEYSLDGGPWVSNTPNGGSYVFGNVGIGKHTISARDINGCGITSATLTIIDYPSYFTPNGDGKHDTWNIIGIENQPEARIFIFDRYGKLIKQITPAGLGWDGSYNNKLMPSDDYWFKVEYLDANNTKKEFKTHFTLKR